MMNKAILQCKTNIYKIKAYAQIEEIYINNDTNQTIKHNISLYISIPISYFTPLIPYHLPLSSHGFDPPIMPSRPKIQYKAFSYLRSFNAGVSLLRLKI